jgi:hypothetical protein
MIKRIERDLATLDLDALESVQRSAWRTLVEIEPYLERLHCGRTDLQAFQLDDQLFHAVEKLEGVLVDPALPTGFDALDQLKHDGVQRSRWWGRPFIERIAWDGPYGLEARERATQAALAQLSPDQEGNQRIEALRTRWFSAWPSGICYEVRCLDGAAKDRATSWGTFASMAEALECAVNRW